MTQLNITLEYEQVRLLGQALLRTIAAYEELEIQNDEIAQANPELSKEFRAQAIYWAAQANAMRKLYDAILNRLSGAV